MPRLEVAQRVSLALARWLRCTPRVAPSGGQLDPGQLEVIGIRQAGPLADQGRFRRSRPAALLRALIEGHPPFRHHLAVMPEERPPERPGRGSAVLEPELPRAARRAGRKDQATADKFYITGTAGSERQTAPGPKGAAVAPTARLTFLHYSPYADPGCMALRLPGPPRLQRRLPAGACRSHR